MRRPMKWARVVVATGALACTLTGSIEASNVVHMTLRDLVARADRIVRGTVVAANEGNVPAGGGLLPIMTYRIRVEDALKGGAAAGDMIEVRLLTTPKSLVNGPNRRAVLLRDLPQFSVGRDYLFVLTRPSRIGLSTTVGLGQGLFQLHGRPGQEQAVNEANNIGLFSGIQGGPQTPGPVAYATLVEEIRTLLGK